MSKYLDNTFSGERSLFSLKDSVIDNCVFKDGESPLKESRNLKIYRCTFQWKYPIWYADNIEVFNSTLLYTARSGIWYTKNISIRNSQILAPKTFRYAENITLDNTQLVHADETLWNCKSIRLNQVKARGDYLGFHSENVDADHLYLEGNYAFDSAKNITIKNSTLFSKDSFWNCENVMVVNSTIIGEYIGWNSKNVTFINCTIESHQGFCYMEKVILINCKVINSDLTFEYSNDIDAEIINVVDSIKNPYSGTIRVKDVKELIMDDKFIEPSETKIIIDKNE